jgi:hypothetical protein
MTFFGTLRLPSAIGARARGLEKREHAERIERQKRKGFCSTIGYVHHLI